MRGCGELDFTGGSGFYVNDIQVNEVNAAPGPIPGAGLLSYIALGLFGVGSVGWRWLRFAGTLAGGPFGLVGGSLRPARVGGG